MKLSSKITIVVSASTLLTAIFAGGFIYFSFKSSLEKEIGERQMIMALDILADVDRFIFNKAYRDVQLIATLDFIKVAIFNQADFSTTASKLNTLSQYSGPWGKISLVDTEGKIVFSTKEAEINKNVKDNLSFKKALSGVINYSDVVLQDGKPALIFYTPVYEDEKFGASIIGVVVADFSWLSVLDILESRQNSILMLYNKDGAFIGSNKAEQEAYILKTEYENYSLGTIPGSKYTTTDCIFSKSKCLTSYVVERGYYSFGGNNWILLMQAPKDTILASAINSALVDSALIILIVLIIGFCLVFIVRRYYLKPVIALSNVTKDIASGDFAKRARIFSNDELGELGHNFNVMAQTLISEREGLVKKVEEQTKELSDRVINLERSRKAIVNVLGDLKQEKEETIMAKKKMEAILAGMGEGVFVIDNDYKIIIFNKIAANISGYSEKEAMGKKFNEILTFLSEKDHVKSDKFIEDIFSTGKMQAMPNTMVLKKKDGTFLPVADSAAPVKDACGHIIGCVVIFRDVTIEREIDRSKSEFVSIASHQLRTPLTAIRWYIEEALDESNGKLNKRQKEYLAEADESNLRMITLVSALLNVSRIDLGTFAIVPMPTNLIELAEGAIKDVLPQAKKKKLVIEKKYDKNLPTINLDPKLTIIVFQNFISNAVKYTPNGGKITVTVKKDGKNALVTVQDTGYGIPEGAQSKLFSKFYRADNARKYDPAGNGLGLYITKAIVEKSNGKIWFESEENKGTTFFASFPLSGVKEKPGKVGLELM